MAPLLTKCRIASLAGVLIEPITIAIAEASKVIAATLPAMTPGARMEALSHVQET